MLNIIQVSRFHLVCIIFISHNSRIWSLAGNVAPSCKTETCQQYADIYLKNMNRQGSPCNDFYDYVCHGWGKQNPRPQTEDRWDVESAIDLRTVKQLKKLLEDKGADTIPEVKQAKFLYKTCMNRPFMERSATIKNVMDQVGNWPMFLQKGKHLQSDLRWYHIDNEYSRKSGESAFFDFNVIATTEESREILLHAKPLYSPFGMLRRFVPWFGNEDRNHYKRFLREVIEIVAPTHTNLFKDQIEEQLEQVIRFRDDVVEIINNENSGLSNTTTIGSFQEWYNQESEPNIIAHIDWLEKFRSMLKNGMHPSGSPVDTNTKINVHYNYFQKFSELLWITRKDTLINHIHLYFAERHVLLNENMESELKRSIHHKIRHPLTAGAIRYNIPRWQNCIKEHNYKRTLRKMYIASHFPDKDKKAAEQLIENSKKLLEQEILSSNWLNYATKRMSADKIALIKSIVGSSEGPELRTTPERSIRYHQDLSPLEADVYYVTNENNIYVSAAYLKWPMYSPNLPYVVEYGSTVSTFGHELYHALDSEGLQYNIHGKKPWWPINMYMTYIKQSKCFVNQYDKYRADEMRKYNCSLETALYDTTADEDIADVMGLKLAYKGYRKRLAEEKGKCSVLPGFENDGCERLFFIAFANTFCADLTEAYKVNILLNDVHNLANVRVNGAVANMPEFSRAFSCKSSDRLNLRQRCDIWKN